MVLDCDLETNYIILIRGVYASDLYIPAHLVDLDTISCIASSVSVEKGIRGVVRPMIQFAPVPVWW